jgi:acyl-CoA oxidase
MPGVTIEDMGYKMGLNGVDNAKLSFNNVRVPREALLNRWSDVAEVRNNHDSALFISAKALKGQLSEMVLCLMYPLYGAQ